MAQGGQRESVSPSSGSRLGNALRNIPFVGFALGSLGDIVSGQVGHGVSSFVNTITTDIGATIVGAFGKVYVTGRDIYRMGGALFSGNMGALGKSIATFAHDLIIPTYGWYGGAGWGLDQDGIWGKRSPFNSVDSSSRQHDIDANDWGWVARNWASTSGPVGSAYTLLGTVPFIAADYIRGDGKP